MNRFLLDHAAVFASSSRRMEGRGWELWPLGGAAQGSRSTRLTTSLVAACLKMTFSDRGVNSEVHQSTVTLV
ncbi:hypothetical protein E2C01_036321 [Portunus trituberculatus]|uniref:Uncharacterized protein n=1 Tax=Portunus trituberculatus TaxID=210409 RepID=A0A5B7FDW9_PORTR|nr:hypothetical protein [Portunus trituberculatus]